MWPLRIVLLANWGLGLEALKILHSLAEVEVTAVVTSHDLKSQDPWRHCVHDFASRHGYPVLNEVGLSFDQLSEMVTPAQTDLLVCHAFMKLLPRLIFTAPTYGAINIHPSLLPRYRGPSPTYWILKNKEAETGLTCHYVDQGFDTGEIISQVRIALDPTDTLSSIIEKQKQALWRVLPQALSRVVDPWFAPLPQDDQQASNAPRPEA